MSPEDGLIARRKLEQAIAAQESLRGSVDDSVLDSAIAVLKSQLEELNRRPEQQRKLITILFMDIVGSTRMVHDLDPEDNLAIVDGAMKHLAIPVAAYGGHINRFMGDGFLAQFGYPVAHENDPDNALRAGLGILGAANEYARIVQANWGIEGFNVRVGINTGFVVIGQGSENENTIGGEAVNLAARLESAAKPGTILISQHTYFHVRGAFDLVFIEPIRAKGYPEPIPVYRVLGEKRRSFRTWRRGVEGVETRMVGRDRELSLLQEVFQAVVEDGERQALTIVGEAGIGKSRLLYEFENWIDVQPEQALLFRGSGRQETLHCAFNLWRDLFAFRFNIQDDDKLALVQKKLEDGIGEIISDQESFTISTSDMHDSFEMQAHFIGQLLGYDFSDSKYIQGIRDDSQQLYDRAAAYLGDFFKRQSQQFPVLLILEDLHWADNSSLDLLAHISRSLKGHAFLFVAAARDELYQRRPHWMEGFDFHQRLDLQPLTRRASEHLVGEVLKKVSHISPDIKDLLISNAEGNPFYMEELVKMLVDSHVILTGEETWQVNGDRLSGLHVPETMTGVLQARLDSLPVEERTTLQQASVIGRVFWDKSLEYLNQKFPNDVDFQLPQIDRIKSTLGSLRAKEMVFQREISAFEGAREHIFKHALLRDVTYQSVLQKLRSIYHALVADYLIQASGERVNEYAGMIADHFAAAQDNEQEATWQALAGRLAAERFAHLEAIPRLSRALDLLAEDRLLDRFELLKNRQQLYRLKCLYELEKNDLGELQKIADKVNSPKLQADVAQRRAWHEFNTDHFDLSIEYGQNTLELANIAGDLSMQSEAHRVLGASQFAISNYSTAGQHFEDALGCAKAVGSQYLEHMSLTSLGYNSSLQGEFSRAQSCFDKALEITRQTSDFLGETFVLLNLGINFVRTREYLSGFCYLDQSLERSRIIAWGRYEVLALEYLVYVTTTLGQHSLAMQYQDQLVSFYREIGDKSRENWSLIDMAYLHNEQEDYSSAYRILKQVQHLTSGILVDPIEADYQSCLGDIMFGLGNTARSIEAYQIAIQMCEDNTSTYLSNKNRANLAHAFLIQGSITAALNQVECVLGYLQSQELDGTKPVMRIYLNCFTVLQQAGDERALPLLERAHTELKKIAEQLDDATRQTFLENVRWNREIIRLWETYKTG